MCVTPQFLFKKSWARIPRHTFVEKKNNYFDGYILISQMGKLCTLKEETKQKQWHCALEQGLTSIASVNIQLYR